MNRTRFAFCRRPGEVRSAEEVPSGPALLYEAGSAAHNREQNAVQDGFELDARLAADSYPLGDWPLCRVLLMDDARFPWLILVPRRAGLVEIIDLAPAERALLIEEIARAQAALSRVTQPDKLNLGALGNVVRQLHVHIVARFVSDPAGPGPVWGVGERKPYPAHMAGALIDRLQKALGFST